MAVRRAPSAAQCSAPSLPLPTPPPTTPHPCHHLLPRDVRWCAPSPSSPSTSAWPTENHAVREAACLCAGELAAKLPTAALKPHASSLVAALTDCLDDQSWPVREGACTACAQLLDHFAPECAVQLPAVLRTCWEQLTDNIPSVRESAAAALAAAARAYGDDVRKDMVRELSVVLKAAEAQPAESARFDALSNETAFGVAAKKARDNDVSTHENQIQYSCGSLAPKLGRRRRGKLAGGCTGCDVTRDRQPWEVSAGALCLLREIAPQVPEAAAAQLPQLAALCRLDSFAHHHQLWATAWSVFPPIATAVGKKAIKPHLELLLPPLFRAARSEHAVRRPPAARPRAARRRPPSHPPPPPPPVTLAGGGRHLLLHVQTMLGPSIFAPASTPTSSPPSTPSPRHDDARPWPRRRARPAPRWAASAAGPVDVRRPAAARLLPPGAPTAPCSKFSSKKFLPARASRKDGALNRASWYCSGHHVVPRSFAEAVQQRETTRTSAPCPA